jgi:NADP-dependent 3-hydroxy acid dehydrogenase YdfG
MGLSLKPLNEQVIVPTGASSGIGLCTAEAAAKGGAKVVLSARSGETLNEVVNPPGRDAVCAGRVRTGAWESSIRVRTVTSDEATRPGW